MEEENEIPQSLPLLHPLKACSSVRPIADVLDADEKMPTAAGLAQNEEVESRTKGVVLDMNYLYACKFCCRVAVKPVLSAICGHLFCWGCIYRRLKFEPEQDQRCPCCGSHLDITPNEMTVVPVYSGRYPADVAPLIPEVFYSPGLPISCFKGLLDEQSESNEGSDEESEFDEESEDDNEQEKEDKEEHANTAAIYRQSEGGGLEQNLLVSKKTTTPDTGGVFTSNSGRDAVDVTHPLPKDDHGYLDNSILTEDSREFHEFEDDGEKKEETEQKTSAAYIQSKGGAIEKTIFPSTTGVFEEKSESYEDGDKRTNKGEIPPCPHRGNMSRYTSIYRFINDMLSLIFSIIGEISYTELSIHISGDLEYTERILCEIDAIVTDLLLGWKWLTGCEYPQGSVVSCELRDLEVKKHPQYRSKALIKEGTDFHRNLEHFLTIDDATYTAESIHMFSCMCCSNIPHQPVVTRCGHLFCWACLYRGGSGSGLVPCPKCGKILDVIPDQPSIRTINGTITLPKEVYELFVINEAHPHKENDDKLFLPPYLTPFSVGDFMRIIIEAVEKEAAELKKKIHDLHQRWTYSGVIDKELKLMASCPFTRLKNEWQQKLMENEPD